MSDSSNSSAPVVTENPMSDPNKRNIFTKDGNVVQMIPDGVILSSGTSSISILKDGSITLIAPNGISVSAGKKLVINGKTVTMEAGNLISLTGAKGADIKIRKDNITIKAKEIFEN